MKKPIKLFVVATPDPGVQYARLVRSESDTVAGGGRLNVIKEWPPLANRDFEYRDGSMRENCFGHALGVGRWAGPDREWIALEGIDGFWPYGVPKSQHIRAWVAVLRGIGWRPLRAPRPFNATERQIALYGTQNGRVLHAALLTENRWESKSGCAGIISGHELDDVADRKWGHPRWFFVRARYPKS